VIRLEIIILFTTRYIIWFVAKLKKLSLADRHKIVHASKTN